MSSEKKQSDVKRIKSKDRDENVSESVTGGARVGGSQVVGPGPGQEFHINTSGGSYVGGNINTGGGDFVGRDKIHSKDQSSSSIVLKFQTIYRLIDSRHTLDEIDKSDLRIELATLQEEIAKGDEANEVRLSRQLRNIRRIDSDIFNAIVKLMRDPNIKFNWIVREVAKKQSG